MSRRATTHHIFTIILDMIIVIHKVVIEIIFMRSGIVRFIWKLVTISLKLRIDIAQLYSR